MPGSPCLTVVLPCYNEAGTIREVVKQVVESPYTHELIVVDDGSTDGTVPILDSFTDPRVRVLRHHHSQGTGAAQRRGFAEAQAPFVIALYHDLYYDQQEY